MNTESESAYEGTEYKETAPVSPAANTSKQHKGDHVQAGFPMSSVFMTSQYNKMINYFILFQIITGNIVSVLGYPSE